MACGYLNSKSSRISSIIGLKLASAANFIEPDVKVSVRPLLFSLAHDVIKAAIAIVKNKLVNALFIFLFQIIKELSGKVACTTLTP